MGYLAGLPQDDPRQGIVRVAEASFAEIGEGITAACAVPENARLTTPRCGVHLLCEVPGERAEYVTYLTNERRRVAAQMGN
jgi:hypothetical protein